MSGNIQIKLFDGFTIEKEGRAILQNLSNTRKTKLFAAYLIANRDRSVTHQELFELLWSEEEYANPATALRTLLYRFRNMIESEGATDLEGAIISKKGTYQWNKNLNISIDTIDFRAYAKTGLDENMPAEVRKDNLEKAIEIYKGSLLPDFCSEPWLISKSAAYRDLYVDVVESYISILKEEKQFAKIVEVCERAQRLAGTSEIITLENGLARLSAANPAGSNLDNSNAYYNQIKAISNSLRDDMDKIQEELEDDTVEQKAYLCDYRTFKEIYRLQRRMHSRSKATVFLGVINVNIDEVESEASDLIHDEKIMNDILECCQRQLRCGDAICRKNESQITILFPAESYEDAMGVLERLKTNSLERINDAAVLVYRVRPLKNAKQ